MLISDAANRSMDSRGSSELPVAYAWRARGYQEGSDVAPRTAMTYSRLAFASSRW